ncbi:methyl-accepting chemotaxis protein [Candidatus Venteria ishoeyi]|uniref:Methyl-accepting chemotaxis protein PctC n=1 Tax=Candidatus Venteria ishoeyi TaxID=1899563 RepID=A0A1H6F8U8_9GAMM|nr:methyl-accepting chemotaxis protein [Candidatus Venteria ishoeyi]MDM8547191.1 methyl-accepting chemotaxis protein [Candidatus Venteria ishoeyi]SEH06542.1 Methyl-accepting chemotaxis protein PctC [Candidatus Venteria ishoeyi]
MKIRSKMILGSIVLAVIPVVITAYLINNIAVGIGEQSLQSKSQSHISSIRDSKKQQIEDYFKLVTNQLQFFSNEPTTVNMLKSLSESFGGFTEEVAQSGGEMMEGPPEPGMEETSELPVEEFTQVVDEYYSGSFSDEYESLNPDQTPNMTEVLGRLSPTTLALQYYYIANNPNPLGTKEEFIGAKDGSSYSTLHAEYHPSMVNFMERFVFEDIFLINNNGDIVYSVLKSIDFATSLKDGPYAESGLGQVYAALEETTSTKDHVKLVDFSPYLPSYQKQAAFIGVPVFDATKKIGVVVFQLPIDKINDIMTYDRAWRLDESGRSGETVIVATDGTMRNDSRSFVEDKENYLMMVEGMGTPADIISEMEQKDTTVGLQIVDNPGTRAALAGVTGFDLFEDYKGEFVLSAFAPINVPGLSWAIFSNLSEDESLEQLATLQTGIGDGSWLIGVGVLLGGALLGLLFSVFFARPINHMEAIVSRVAEGDFTARAEIKTNDELETLSKAFNSLLDDRLSQLAKAEKENEMLNNSIIELLKASFQLSQRDLTVQVPVTQDVTGPLADAINQMASETSKVLLNVRNISDEVEVASSQVKTQAHNVSDVADAEREVVSTTMTELAAASEAMNKIAEVAQSCNEIAAEATRTTQTALETVTGTVNGMSEIRETIHETEKRIKRLGERSQEISGIVDIINNIAERTHVLALNASMQAAAAGEAGRGFSVVADEVQRLAESSRNATSQISALVKNIQVETNDTIATMDKTIGQVVEGSRLAERAGEQMKETQGTTANLVKVVEQIAMASQQQARISNELREHALSIQATSEETGRQLQEQIVQTDQLVEYANQLIESIRVFRLPTA